MFQKEAQKVVIGCNTRPPRIITASFRTRKKTITLNILLRYAPTNDKTDETTE